MSSSTINSVQPRQNDAALHAVSGKYVAVRLICTILICGSFIFQSALSQPLFTYGSKSVSREEFTKAYRRNNDITGGVKPEDVRNYAELYARYKLKVQSAYDQKLDTIVAKQEDVLAFRSQLEEPFVRDNALLDRLVAEAAERGKKDIRVSHIFIPFRKEFIRNPLARVPATALDSALAIKRIMEAHELLNKGADFSEVATTYSDDPAVKTNKGDLGYITVFSLPYELENLVYALPLQGTSKPYRSGAGWHIFRKTGERDAVGKMKVAQILVAVDSEGGLEEKKRAASLADSLYRALVSGSAFEELASTFSYDLNSAPNGGLLPLIGIGEYDPVFEQQVFSLKQNGDITKPFETSAGYHIVKRIDAVRYDHNDLQYNWRTAVETDNRGQLPRKAFEKVCIARTGMKMRPVDEKELWRYTDSMIITGNPPYSPVIKSSTVLFEFADSKVTVQDWQDYLSARLPQASVPVYKALFEQFTTSSALGYYRRNLERYDPDFRAQYNEFMEGNMLFEAMERNVWNKASTDTVGQKKLYAANSSKYMWQKSADLLVFHAPDSAMAVSVRNAVMAAPRNWREIEQGFDGQVSADSARMDWSQLNLGEQAYMPGHTTGITVNREDGTAMFYHITKVYPQQAVKTYDEAKGQLISDLQVVLEENWISSLKKKYPVKINEAALQQAIKELSAN